MNSFEIERKIRTVDGIGRYFVGVFSSDKLPKKVPPYCFVANTDPSAKPGSHWCAFFVFEKWCEFFDSYGRSPNNPTLPLSFMQFIGNKPCYYNSLFLEGIFSKTCGDFCVYYIILRSTGVNFANILASFSKNRIVNDKFVTRFVEWI